MFFFAEALAQNAPAGGAALDQVVIATAGAGLATAVVAWLIHGHRTGRFTALTRLSDFSARVGGIPGWAALPQAVAGISLMIALLGMYWDIALHIDNGRDEGPLANPAHFLILGGLYGVFTAGVLACALPRKGETPGPASVQLLHGWRVPVGGLLVAAAGGFALIGFPLDDVWHRLFGQDVTLWGPTHLMLIGGAGMTLVGMAILLAEGMRARASSGHRRQPSLVVAFRRVGVVGGFLIGLSTFQAEFDFGVPQFQQVFQPFLIALAAGVALLAGRLWIGPGGALAAALFFLVVRGGVAVLVGPVFGQSMPSQPLYVPAALAVELAALMFARRPLALAAVGGLLIGTVGYLAEHAWSQVAMPLPWTGALLPEGMVVAVIGGVAGAFVGALMALGLQGRLPAASIARAVPALASLAVGGVLVYGLITTTPDVRAGVTLGAEGRADVTVVPATAADDAKWFTVTAWQGEGLEVIDVERTGPGTFRSVDPVPTGGNWKSILRLHTGRAVVGVPVQMPEDRAIPAPAVEPQASPQPFVRDTQILQRERKDDVAGWIWGAAGAVVLVLYLAFLAALAWGVGRVGRATGGGGAVPPAPPRTDAGPTPREPVPLGA